MRPLRSLVVGLGTHARRGHVDHFAASGIELVAAADTSPAALEAFRATREGAACELGQDYRPFLLRDDVEAVFVMTPDRFHVEQTFHALYNGKHVFCEKPMADAASLDRLGVCLALARERGVVLTSCHPRRFDRPFMWLRDRLPALVERLGPAIEFRFDFLYAKPSKAGLHAGLLADHFNHEIDLLHFLFGHAPFSARRLFDDEVRYHAAGIRDDGIAFAFGGTRMLDAPRYPETAAVRFARGELRLDTGTGVARIEDRDAREAWDEECGTTDYDGRFRAVNRDFAETVRGLAPGYLEPRDLWVNTESSVRLTTEGFYRCA